MVNQNRDRCCYIAKSTKRQCRVNPGNDEHRESKGLLPLCGAHQRWEGRSDLNDCVIEEWKLANDLRWIDDEVSAPEGVLESATDRQLKQRGNTLWSLISEGKEHLALQVGLFNRNLCENDIYSDMKRHYITDLMEKLYIWQSEIRYASSILEGRVPRDTDHHVSPSASAIHAPAIQ